MPRFYCCFAAGFVLAAGAAFGATPFPTYNVYNLGTLGGLDSVANTITPGGIALGNSDPAGDATTTATAWLNGLQAPLGTLGGPNSAIGWPTRSDLVFAGYSETAAVNALGEAWSCSAFFPQPPTGKVCLGFRFANGTMTALPTLGGIDGYAAGVNSRGDIVGWAETPVHDKTCVAPQVLQFEAVRYGANGSVDVLPPLAKDRDSAATAINNAGVAVGISGICGESVGAYSARHAVVWSHGVPAEIRMFGGHGWNTPTDVNNHGQITGFGNLSGDVVGGQLQYQPVAFIAEVGGKAQKILPLPGDGYDAGDSVNDKGLLVGQSFGGVEGSRAFVWQNGLAADMNDLVAGGDPLYLVYATDVNSSGEIVGQACVVSNGSCTQSMVAFLAVPTTMAARAPVAGVRVAPENYLKGLRRFGVRSVP